MEYARVMCFLEWVAAFYMPTVGDAAYPIPTAAVAIVILVSIVS